MKRAGDRVRPPGRELLAGPAVAVAPTLLGALVRSTVGGSQVLARITEVEAYEGGLDPASHAYRGPSRRNAVMFGAAGHLYCYFVYGMHWCANVVCGEPGIAAAVLLRAAEIVEGEQAAAARTETALPLSKLASGPARLARSLGLTGVHSGLDLLDSRSPVQLIQLAAGSEFTTGPRVGVAAAVEHPWRFWVPGDPTVSSYRPGGRKRAGPSRQTDRP